MTSTALLKRHQFEMSYASLCLLVAYVSVGSAAAGPPSVGKWGPVVTWPDDVIPVSLVNVPGGNSVLGFAAANENTFKVPPPQNNAYTHARLFDLDNGRFTTVDLNGHDMFCAGMSLLSNGHLLAVGGGKNDNSFRVSVFDPFKKKWMRKRDTALGHWYGTLVVTRDDRAMIALGVNNNIPSIWRDEFDFPEISAGNLNFKKPWQNMSTLDLSGKGPDRNHWYPVLHLMPSGDVLESGTQNSMYVIDTFGTGSIKFAGKRNKEREEKEAWGAATIMYERGKLITIGGIENWYNLDMGRDRLVYSRAITIDMNDPSNIKTEITGEMAFPRAFPNLVVLPSGEVLAIGGKRNVRQLDDSMSVFSPEIWDPNTGLWRILSKHKKPRNYHSTAILLRDGRVMSGGGGLCEVCPSAASNQPNHEIFTPPYLLDDKNQLRKRPEIFIAPQIVRKGEIFEIVVEGMNAGNITRVSFVKQSAVTHSITTDARQLELEVAGVVELTATRYRYKVRGITNLNIMTPGYWFLFVLDLNGTPSEAAEVKVAR